MSIRKESRIRSTNRGAFTLVELLVVVSIIGVLVSLTLPAVQHVRESARRTSCANNLRQLGLAVLSFEAANEVFPAGAELSTAHSWGSRILPYLEQENLYDQIDFDQFWESPGNDQAIRTDLSMFLCPSSWKDYAGATDYCGISGSWIGVKNNGSRNGMLYPVSKQQRPVRAGDIRDGLSSTLLIAEGVAVTEMNDGLWGSGLNCFTHDDGPINNRSGGFDEIASLHPGGAQAVFVDGSVHFLTESLEPRIVGALCTRKGQEVVSY